MKTAYMFSGQGAQYIGMGKELYDNFPVYKEVLDAGEEILKFSVRKYCFEENEFIHKTEFTQPLVLLTSLASLAIINGRITPSYMLGLSLGEYSALYASGAISFAGVLRLIKKRGEIMAKAIPEGTSGMAAILKTPLNIIEDAVNKAKPEGIVSICNYNTPEQIVIGGQNAALNKAIDIIKENGGKIIPLKVSGAFHTQLLESASQELMEELTGYDFQEFKTPVISNVTAKPYENKGQIVDILTKQIKSPVRFYESIYFARDNECDTFIEFGPSKTLTGFVSKIDKGLTVFNIEDLKSLDKVLEFLG